MKQDMLREVYFKNRRQRAILIVTMLILICLVSVLSLSQGSLGIGFQKVWITLWQICTQGYNRDDPCQTVLVVLRLPRVLMGILAGFGLGVAGAVFQGVLRNPLASPTTLGVSAAAGLGAALALILDIGFAGKNFLVVGNAFVFSMIPVLVIFSIARFRQAIPEMMILSGIGMSYIFGSVTSILEFLAAQDALKAMVVWLMGSLGRAKWGELSITALVLCVCIPMVIWRSWDLNLMGLGDDAAKSLGTNPDRSRLILMAIASLITATIICFTGMIGFIGLVSPHICRIFLGADNRMIVPVSGIFGAVFLIISDLVSRTIIAPVIIPVGIITSCVGGPLFLYLIITKKKQYW
nr:iron ABC transporter permease [uncultured Desulfobacter sp.]